MTILKKDALSLIMIGATHVIDMGGKSAHIYYETETNAHMQLPDGSRRHGRWSLGDDGYTVAWTDGPTASWKFDHTPGSIDYIDQTGAPRGKVLRIEFGDSAGIAT